MLINRNMKKNLLSALILTGLFIFNVNVSNAQKNGKELNCFERYEEAFNERGAYTTSDNIYRNVMISFFEGDDVFCVRGKVRVEKGYISHIFYYYDDNTEELYDKKFHNVNGEPPSIKNGISELIINQDRERLRVVFIDRLKPKKKQLQRMDVPDDL